ncbi:MAG TPA: porin [Candidatus Competibacteraceae bacterium]|nr:MAG: porin [Candidatus Competibacteraceae bacterium]HOB60988.1 porin [Candidatus Competibacteraceae bacterium]HQA26447.1 porin [Candidatus Competibacteraceae bacterium]HQD55875.1 porin [Candidatus Competibacteraceae bacterium]
MKKSALALAVAAALVGFGSAAYADTTLYGSARVSVDYNDVSAPDGVTDTSNLYQSNWDVYNNSSRLGVRGEEDLGGGLAAIYQYEFGVDITEGGNFNSNRPKWVGLKGASWGSITAGTQWTPYYNVIGIGDIFNSNKIFNSVSSMGSVNPSIPVLNTYLGNTFGLRMDNSLIYSTPNWSGFSGQVMLVMNGECPPTDANTPSQLCKADSSNKVPANVSDGIDLWNISASYKNGPFFAGATYMALEGSSYSDYYTAPTWNGDQWGLAFGYNSGPFAVSLTFEDGDVNTVYVGDSQNWYLTGQYTFGNNVIRASYGYLAPDDSMLYLVDGSTIKQGDLNNYAVGYQYNFSKRTRVWVEYFGSSADGQVYGDINGVSIGTRVDF